MFSQALRNRTDCPPNVDGFMISEKLIETREWCELIGHIAKRGHRQIANLLQNLR